MTYDRTDGAELAPTLAAMQGSCRQRVRGDKNFVQEQAEAGYQQQHGRDKKKGNERVERHVEHIVGK